MNWLLTETVKEDVIPNRSTGAMDQEEPWGLKDDEPRYQPATEDITGMNFNTLTQNKR